MTLFSDIFRQIKTINGRKQIPAIKRFKMVALNLLSIEILNEMNLIRYTAPIYSHSKRV